MNKKKIMWITIFIIMISFTVITLTKHKGEISLAVAIRDNSNILFYTEGEKIYNMTELLEWYDFKIVNVIVLENETLIAKHVKISEKRTTKRTPQEIRAIVESDRELIMKYPEVARRYMEKKSSKGSSYIPVIS